MVKHYLEFFYCFYIDMKYGMEEKAEKVVLLRSV